MLTDVNHTPRPRTDAHEARRAALASYFGGTREYYDLYSYASAAALVFNKVFLPGDRRHRNPRRTGHLRLAYVARPLGAIVLGHLADRFGRKRALLITLIMMGVRPH